MKQKTKMMVRMALGEVFLVVGVLMTLFQNYGLAIAFSICWIITYYKNTSTILDVEEE